MSAFEFFFSFYGLVLGLSVAVIATGVATAIQHRHKIRIGYLTPILALFVGLDIATFWDSAWHTLKDAPYTYGLLIASLAIALVYFIAASLVYPHQIEDGMNLDDHFWANKRTVLLLTTAANTMMVLVCLPGIIPKGIGTLINIAALLGLYVVLVVPAALARRKTLFLWTLGAHIVIYLAIAALALVATAA